MFKEEFYKIVKSEKLDRYNIADSDEISQSAHVVGIAHDNGWTVYTTDERASYQPLSCWPSREEAYFALFEELRNMKKKESILQMLQDHK